MESDRVDDTGVVQRICDAVAYLSNPNGTPVAGIVEIQTKPDNSIFDRIGVAGHILRLTRLPFQEKQGRGGDRWDLAGIVLNLTGNPDDARSFQHAGSEWTIRPRQRNIAACDAALILEQIARGEIPDSVSAFVSLMTNGGSDVTIERWFEVTAHFDPSRRREFAAANVVFADLNGCQDSWRSAVEARKMGESQYLNSLRNEARNEGRNEGHKEGRNEGRTEARAEMLLRMLGRVEAVPADLTATIRACTDQAKLEAWFDLAFERPSLAEFRQKAGLLPPSATS